MEGYLSDFKPPRIETSVALNRERRSHTVSRLLVEPLQTVNVIRCRALIDRSGAGGDHLAGRVKRLVLGHVGTEDAGECTDLSVLDERGSVVGLHREGGMSESVRSNRLTSPSAVRWNESV